MNATNNLPHSVAFRVSEAEWQQLGRLARQKNLSVGGLARVTVLALIDVRVDERKRHSLRPSHGSSASRRS